jgi:hypothetical protein
VVGAETRWGMGGGGGFVNGAGVGLRTCEVECGRSQVQKSPSGRFSLFETERLSSPRQKTSLGSAS